MKRLLLALLVLTALAVGVQRLAHEDPPAAGETPAVDHGPGRAFPLPGYREDVATKADPRHPARLQGRPPPEEVRGLLVRVVDPDGTPVPQAVVVVERGRGEDWREWVETAANGAVRVAGPQGEQTTNVEVSDPRDAAGAPLALLPRRVEGIGPGTGEVVVELAWSRRLTGSVRTLEGDPVGGATVRAGPPERFSAGREAVTDDDGRFELVGLPPGPLEARVARNAGWIGPPATEVTARQVHVAFEVDRLVPFRVTVVGPDGRPVPGVRVLASWGSAGVPGELTRETDADGAVLLPSVPRSTSLAVSTRWHDPAPEYPDVCEPDVRASDGAVALRLPAPATLEGTVHDAAGRPIAHGSVSATFLDHPRGWPLASIDSQGRIEDGRFRIGRLHAGRYRLVVHAAGFLGRTRPIEVRAPSRDLRIRLEPTTDVAGRVRGARPESSIVQWFAAGMWAQQGKVSEDGSFRIGDVTSGSGTLYVFDAETGASALVEDVRPTDGPFEVECHAGLPIAGLVPGYAERVWTPSLCCVRGPLQIPIRIQPDGRFAVPPLPRGTWQLEWRYGDRVLGAVAVDAGEDQAIVPLPPEALRAYR